MEEKRKFIRIEAPIVVTYELADKTSTKRKTITKDFSEGGIRFPVYERLRMDTPVELHIETSFDTTPISATGQIVWTKALSTKEGREIYDIGVKFTKMQTLDKIRCPVV